MENILNIIMTKPLNPKQTTTKVKLKIPTKLITQIHYWKGNLIIVMES